MMTVSTLPYALLEDPAVMAAEELRIFGRSWSALAFAADLAEPGQTLTARLGRVPVVLARGADGVLRGFVNVCRHRGHPVAEGDGARRLLLCRYHGWSYGLDGCLLRAPATEQIEGFDRGALGLAPVAVAEWRGVIFAHPDPNAPPLADANPALEVFGADAAFDLGAHHPFRTQSFDIPANWKLVLDNAVECYHCPTIHSASLNRLYETSGFGGAVWSGAVRHSRAEMTKGRGRHDCIVLFPGSYLAADSVLGILGRIEPDGPSRTRLTFRFAATPGADPALAAEFAGLWCETLAEDVTILTEQARGIASGAIAAGVLVPGPENCLIHLRDLVQHMLDDAAAPHQA
jgi:choline monooxygenase